jgi:hypothetical protein
MDIDLRFSTAFWIPLGICALALLFTLIVYRQTVPASSHVLRRTLAFIRYACLVIAALLLFEPVLNLHWTISRLPTLAVLIDESASMTLVDSTSRRSDRLQKLMQRPWIESLKKSSNLQILAFADSLRLINRDSVAALRFAGDGTDIAAALAAANRRFAAENFAAAVVISDGIVNLGENPVRVAQNFPVPVFTIGIGSPQRARDVVITQIATNDIAYAETQLPVEVTIAAVGYDGRRARLRLEDAGGKLIEQEIVLPADNTQITARLTVTPRQLGMNKFTASVEPQPGESSEINNRRSVFVRVLQSKVRIWIVAGGPSADFQFAKRTLEEDKNFSVTGLVRKNSGAFYDGALPANAHSPAWKEIDCLIFIDFPRRDTDLRLIAYLSEVLNATRKPVFWMAGPNTDPGRWWSFQKHLPLSVRPARSAERSVTLAPNAVGFSHPVGRFAESPEENRLLWENLPPVFSNFTNVQASAGAQVIAVADQSASRVPLLIAQKSAETKSLVLLAHDLWRWYLKLVGINKEPAAYRHLMIQGVRWLVTKEDTKLVRFGTNKLIYRGGEAIEMTAQVYYEDYRPRTGARITVQLMGSGYDREIPFEEVGDGLYQASSGHVPGGDYELRGRAELNGQLLGEDTAKFTVEPFRIEYLSTAMNEPLLRKIAEVSGGRYLSPDSLEQFAAEAKFPIQTVEEGKEIAAWGKPSVLLIIVILLAVEWLFRKRHGML